MTSDSPRRNPLVLASLVIAIVGVAATITVYYTFNPWLKQLEESTRDLQKNIDGLRTRELQQLFSDVASLKSEIQQLRTNLQSNSTEIRRLQSDVINLNSEIQKLKSNLGSNSTNLQSNSKEIEQLQFNITSLRSEIQQLRVPNVQGSFNDQYSGYTYSHSVSGFLINFGMEPASNVTVTLKWQLKAGGFHEETIIYSSVAGREIKQIFKDYTLTKETVALSWTITWG